MLQRIIRIYAYIFHKYPPLLKYATVDILAEVGWGMIMLPLQLHMIKSIEKGGLGYDVRYFTPVILAFGITETLLKGPLGALSDRLGRRPLVLSGLFFACVPLALMAVVEHWVLIAVLYGLTGAAAAALWPTMSALIAESVKSEDKATAMSVFNTSYMVGLVGGLLLGLTIGGFIGNRYVFVVAACLLIVAAVLAWAFVRPPKREHPPKAHKPKEGHRAAAMLGVLHDSPVLWKMMVIYVCAQFGIMVVGSIIGPYVDRVVGIPEKEMPLFFLGPGLLTALLALPLGRAADKWGRPQAANLSFFLGFAGMTALYLVRSAPYPVMLGVSVVCMAMLACSYSMGIPSWLGLTSLHAPPHKQGQAIGLMNTAQGIGMVLGTMAGPQLYHNFSPSVPFIASSLAFFLSFVGSVLFVREPQPEPIMIATDPEMASARTERE